MPAAAKKVYVVNVQDDNTGLRMPGCDTHVCTSMREAVRVYKEDLARLFPNDRYHRLVPELIVAYEATGTSEYDFASDSLVTQHVHQRQYAFIYLRAKHTDDKGVTRPVRVFINAVGLNV